MSVPTKLGGGHLGGIGWPDADDAMKTISNKFLSHQPCFYFSQQHLDEEVL